MTIRERINSVLARLGALVVSIGALLAMAPGAPAAPAAPELTEESAREAILTANGLVVGLLLLLVVVGCVVVGTRRRDLD